MTAPMILLAAGQGTRLRPLTEDRPKCMVPLRGRPLVDWHVLAAKAAGVQQIGLVAGYRADALEAFCAQTHPEVSVARNPAFQTTNMVVSLALGMQAWANHDALVVGYGDIVYNPCVIETLLETDFEVGIVVDRQWHAYWQARGDDDLSDTESLVADEQGRIRSIGQPLLHADGVQGQYIGLMVFRGQGLLAMRRLVELAGAADAPRSPCAGRTYASMYMTDLLQALINHGQDLQAVWIDGGWLEVDTPEDLALAESITEIKHGNLVVNR